MEILGERGDAPELLALRALKLGDLLVAVPSIRGLRRAYSGHRLVLAVPGWLAPIADLIGSVDALLPTAGLDDPLPLEPGRADIAVNLHGNGPQSRAMIDRLEARLAIVHRSPGHDGPLWQDGILQRRRWTRLVEAYGIPADENDLELMVPGVDPIVTDAVIVHVGAFYGSRHWPVDRFARVAAALADEGARVLISGSAAERERAAEVAALAGLETDAVVAGELELAELAALIAASRLVVSEDTGVAHLASAFRIPSIVLFGPATAEGWGPPADGRHIVHRIRRCSRSPWRTFLPLSKYRPAASWPSGRLTAGLWPTGC